MSLSTITGGPTEDERRRAVLSAMGEGTRLLRFAARYAPSLPDAEDAYQRAMIIALTKAPTVVPGEFMAWLHTVLRNEALAITRSQAREGPAPGGDVADEAAETLEAPLDIDVIAQWRERYRALNDALEGLTEPQKICLILQ
jgi:RNA polymerase sigma factor (sigma-70 family)